MRILSFNFAMYAISGMWRPVEWTSRCSKLLYSMYSLLMIYLMTLLSLAMFLDIILVVDNIEDFTTNSLLFISIITAFCKAITGLTCRSGINNLFQILQEEPCKAHNEEENNIQMKFDRIIRSYSVNYTLLASISVTGGIVGGLPAMLQGQLPFRIWVPYNYTKPLLFWFTSIQEIVAVLFGTVINTATETSVLGFCLQTCAQLEILKHRLQNITKDNEKAETLKRPISGTKKETNILSGHIHHHLRIISFAKIINDVYSQVFFTQFFGSILVLCSTVYFLSSHMTVTDFMTFAVYSICMFLQIYIYCWAGNEVMIKSVGLSDAVYQMDWVYMTVSVRKDLLMIMKRSTRPIKFTSSFLVTMSLDSYGNLLKTTYSAFNLLQQS